MTALIVIGVIVLIFAILLNFRIRAEISYLGGTVDLKVKYLFFTIFPFKVREKKEKKKKTKKSAKASKQSSDEENSPKSEKTEASASETGSEKTAENPADSEADLTDEELLNPDKPKEKKEKKSLSEKLDGLGEIIEKVEIIWGFAQKGLKRIFGRIRIDRLMIDFTIAGEDAYSTAMNYGRISAVTYNAIGFLQTFFKTSVRSVDIVCDFEGKKSVYDCGAKITIAPASILSAAFILLFGFLRNFRKIIPKAKPKAKNQPDAKKAVTV